MKYNQNDLEEITRIFIKLADKLLKDKKIDKYTYIEITKRKKEFLKYIESNKRFN
ncbi:hypothetical protein [Senegalia massiliensis]|jgi:hypothetical protein|uniref:hypothetical protein n=1 Tax=Senegalia massiliensis TaxID=1720316 RepID=UPI0013EEED5D|nr:hypothetical protein [Senegalia massiliensis]